MWAGDRRHPARLCPRRGCGGDDSLGWTLLTVSTTESVLLTPAGRRWAERATRPLDVLAVVFLVDIVLLWSFPDAPTGVLRLLNLVSWIVWACFAIDYVARMLLSTDRMAYVRTHKLDLLMVLLPMLRLLRVFLVLRKALAEVSTDKIAGSIVSIVIVVVLGSAFLMWRVEGSAEGATITSFRRAIWWAAVTTTTVGYGDYTPITPVGRAIAILLMILGIGLIGTVSATVAAWFVTREGGGTTDSGSTVVPASKNEKPLAADDSRAALVARLDKLAATQSEQEAEIRSIIELLNAPESVV
jgi:voltage-gated potassium channel